MEQGLNETNGASTPDKDSLLLIRLILTFQTAAMQQMGKIADPVHGKIEKNLPEASISIDTLNMLYNKCKGRLTEDEERFFKRVTSELQLNYVDEINSLEKQAGEEPTEPSSQESGQQQENSTDGDATRGSPQ